MPLPKPKPRAGYQSPARLHSGNRDIPCTDTHSWMEGLVLMLLYLIIAVSFWYYPVS